MALANIVTSGATDLDWLVYSLFEDALSDHAAGESQTNTNGCPPP